MSKIIQRDADKELPDVGAEIIIPYGEDSYKVYCTFAFHMFFERAYNFVLKLPRDEWLSIRGLLDRALNRKLDLPYSENIALMESILRDWFLLDSMPVPTKEQIDELTYHFTYSMGVLLGGADAGKKFSLLLARAKIAKNTENL